MARLAGSATRPDGIGGWRNMGLYWEMWYMISGCVSYGI